MPESYFKKEFFSAFEPSFYLISVDLLADNRYRGYRLIVKEKMIKIINGY